MDVNADCESTCLTYCQKLNNVEVCFLGLTKTNLIVEIVYILLGIVALILIGFLYDRFKINNGFQRIKIWAFVNTYKLDGNHQIVQTVSQGGKTKYMIVSNNQVRQQTPNVMQTYERPQ
ncbi:hypothetical protein SS50377_24837 [Spironucleus salmonicida]|uniref:Uncharacterized protein n=1 Tax=Spironucleus salmonicida TaxID=348837 RepID=V6LQ76_9EUKA|nr:hypothetical protein SS50377_24837 [Spironucleus salmonicida]|eukprot:EST46822.1 Hypothetical protein SS50377_13152 [Spironucleus salmonicida]